MYLAYTAPHWPLHARQEDILRYQDTYDDGWQSVREARHKKQLEMGLFESSGTVQLSPRHDAKVDWSQETKKQWETHAMAVHAAMIDRIDQGIGRLVETLRDTGQLDNTLILFLSDNGASPERPAAPGFDRYSQTRRGEAVTYFGGDAARDILPGGERTCAGIGARWANVANTPFRYWKSDQHEGGIRTPLIAHWPAGLTAPAGSITHQSGHVIDAMATCLEVAGVDYPNQFDGRPITPLAGKSLLPILRGRTRVAHKQIFFEHYGQRAVREGNLKLVAASEKPWELYDLLSDPTELHDLAAERPDTVRRLAADWQTWAERTGAVEPSATSQTAARTN
jgi:arylsulfatase